MIGRHTLNLNINVSIVAKLSSAATHRTNSYGSSFSVEVEVETVESGYIIYTVALRRA